MSSILRTALYKDFKTVRLQRDIEQDLNQILKLIKLTEQELNTTRRNVAGVTFNSTLPGGNHAEALKFFDRDFSDLVGFPQLENVNLGGDREFSGHNPISLFFGPEANTSQSGRFGFDLRDFFKNLVTRYALIYSQIQELVRGVNQLFDLIQESGLDKLETYLADFSRMIQLDSFISRLLQFNFNGIANRAEKALEGYLKLLDSKSLPKGFNFLAHKHFNIREYVGGRIDIFNRFAANKYLRDVFNIPEIPPVEFNP